MPFPQGIKLARPQRVVWHETEALCGKRKVIDEDSNSRNWMPDAGT